MFSRFEGECLNALFVITRTRNTGGGHVDSQRRMARAHSSDLGSFNSVTSSHAKVSTDALFSTAFTARHADAVQAQCLNLVC